jgi:sRNA-binding carbon storage regulator CsrA
MSLNLVKRKEEDEEPKKGFLLLSLRVGKGFWIDDTYISINKIKSGKEVSIGIKAPKKVKIDRIKAYVPEKD